MAAFMELGLPGVWANLDLVQGFDDRYFWVARGGGASAEHGFGSAKEFAEAADAALKHANGAQQ